jgi:hypothetical protein
VQNAEEAQLGAEVLGVAGDGQQRFRTDLKEQAVQRLLVVEGEIGDGPRQSEDDMEIRDGRQFSLPPM